MVAEIGAAGHVEAMIDFERVWLPQIVAYAQLISTGRLEAQWLGQAGLLTSITDPDELHEQVFDDLDADGIWAAARETQHLPNSVVSAIDGFLGALKSIEGNDPASIVRSRSWSTVRAAADAVLVNLR